MTTQEQCLSHGLSIYTTPDGVRKARKIVKGFSKKPVVKGILAKGMGKLKNTPRAIKDHHTWWLASDAPEEPETLFTIENI